MSDDIAPMPAMFYASGEDPIDYAAGIITEFIAMHHALQQAAARGTRIRGVSSQHAAYGPGEDVGPLSLGRRAVGWLLEAGWTPPTPEAVAAAAERSRTVEQEVLQHRHEPCTSCGHMLVDHVGAPRGALHPVHQLLVLDLEGNVMTDPNNRLEIADGEFIDIELAGPDDYRKAIALETQRSDEHEMIANAVAADQRSGRSFDGLNGEAWQRFGCDFWDCTHDQMLEMYEGRGIVPAGYLARERRSKMHAVDNGGSPDSGETSITDPVITDP